MNCSEENILISGSNQTFRYIDEGSFNSPAIIFIHGFPFNKVKWNGHAEALKENFRVITCEIHGHENSDPGDDNCSLEFFVNDLLGLMDALKIDKAILCGFSTGGYFALKALENFSRRFCGLLLCETRDPLPTTILISRNNGKKNYRFSKGRIH